MSRTLSECQIYVKYASCSLENCNTLKNVKKPNWNLINFEAFMKGRGKYFGNTLSNIFYVDLGKTWSWRLRFFWKCRLRLYFFRALLEEAPPLIKNMRFAKIEFLRNAKWKKSLDLRVCFLGKATYKERFVWWNIITFVTND